MCCTMVDEASWESCTAFTDVMIGPLVYWIVVASVCGYYLLTAATRYLPASQVAAFQCLQPFMGTVLAFFVLGEQPTFWDLGAVGVVAGLVLVVRETKEAGKVSSVSLTPSKSAGGMKRLRSHVLPFNKLDK